MNNLISIPNPCHENWDNMQAAEQGRHCLVCQKTVIDFSGWSNEDILQYISKQKSTRVCGRFNANQISSTKKETQVLPLIIKSNISILKKIAAIVLLCFGVMSCNTMQAQNQKGEVALAPDSTKNQLMGDTVIIPSDTTKKIPVSAIDTTSTPQIMGKIMLPRPSVIDKKKQKKTKK